MGGYTREQKTVLVLCLAATFCCNVMLGATAPFLPKLNEQHNISSTITGWMIGVFSLCQLIAFPVWSITTNRIGIYELMCWGLLLTGGCTVLFGTIAYIPSNPEHFDWAYVILAFAIRAMLGISSSALVNSVATTLSVMFPDNTTAVMSLLETVIGVGFMCGPAIGSGLYKVGGFMVNFAVIGGVLISLSITMFCVLPKNLCAKENKGPCMSLHDLLSNPRITGTLLAVIYTGMAWSCYDPILEPELRKKYGLTTDVGALVFILISGMYSLLSPVVGKAIDKKVCVNSVLLMSFGMALSCVSFLLAGPFPLIPDFQRPLWQLCVALGMTGISLSLLIVPSINILFENEEFENTPGNMALISGVWQACYSTGDFIGPMLSGMIADHTNFAWTMTVFAGASLVFTVFVLILYLTTLGCKKHNNKVLSPGQIQERQALLSPDSGNNRIAYDT